VYFYILLQNYIDVLLPKNAPLAFKFFLQKPQVMIKLEMTIAANNLHDDIAE
jgi:hypothetical protein